MAPLESARPPWVTGHRLFLLFVLLYAITSSGDLAGDSEIRWAVAVRWMDTGWVDLLPDTTHLFAQGTDGKAYSFYGPAQSALFVPFVLAGRGLASLLDSTRFDPNLLGQFLASLVLFPACGAAAVVMAYAVALEASGERRTARRMAVIFGLATMHWHHTVNTYEESQVALCTLVGLWAVQRTWSTSEFRYRLLSVVPLGVALAFRVSSVMLSAPLGLVAVFFDLRAAPRGTERRRRTGQWLVALGVGLVPFLILLGWFNATRFGSVFETGYGLAQERLLPGIGLFDTPLWTGLTGMLFSPGKSVFLFNPVLLAAITGFASLSRTHPRLTLAWLCPVVATVLFHSAYTFWAGDLAWGPRYLASAMGLCTLGLLPGLRPPQLPRALTLLLVASILVQAASVVYSFGLEFFQDRRHGTIPDGYVWRPVESQWACRFRNLARHFLGRPVYESVPPLRENVVTCQRTTSSEQVQRMHVVNFFPFKAYAATKNRRLFHGLLAIWVCGVGALVLLAAGEWRRPEG